MAGWIQNQLIINEADSSGSAYAGFLTPTSNIEEVPIRSSTDTFNQDTATTLQNSTPTPRLPNVLPLNTAVLAQGFGSYLDGILPSDIATACGAFSASMRQVRNIENVPIEKFAQVATNIETTRGLTLVNGTDVPSNLALAAGGATAVALGSGPDGTYTASDFFGAMSGLPYPWKDIQSNISLLQTPSLAETYKQLYLAVTWERATASVQYTTYTDGFGTTYYHVTGVTITDAGGGYGRGGAGAPTVTMTGGTCTATISTDDTNAGSNGSGTFGRVTALNFTSGADITTVPTISIDYPPGGSSFSNVIVQDYIDDANAEITSIFNSNRNSASNLNTLWNITGIQLTIEQRTRQTAISPVPYPRDVYLSQYPTGIMAFVDSIPQFSINTLPHMYAQTLEAISDWKTPGGQSIVGTMRQERNTARLVQTGISLDNNIAGNISPKATKLLLANGTLSTANPGAGIQVDNATFTNPATLSQVDENNQIVGPLPIGIYNTALDAIVVPETFRNAGVLGTLPTLINDTIIVEPGDDLNEKINPVVNYIPSGPTVPLDTGKAGVPGSLAGSSYQNAIPTELKLAYIAGTLSPASFNVQEAIDEVIKCNCDCWID